MSKKVFNILIQFDVLAVTCPGVWLCSNGDVFLQIKMLSKVLRTENIPPVFPLLYHEGFTIGICYPQIRNLSNIIDRLSCEQLSAILIQKVSPCKNITLATFKASLLDVLFPRKEENARYWGADVDLLMEPSKRFPGIISPKIELSTNTKVEEIMSSEAVDTAIRKPLSSKKPEHPFLRRHTQRTVCPCPKFPYRYHIPTLCIPRIRKTCKIHCSTCKGQMRYYPTSCKDIKICPQKVCQLRSDQCVPIVQPKCNRNASAQCPSRTTVTRNLIRELPEAAKIIGDINQRNLDRHRKETLNESEENKLYRSNDRLLENYERKACPCCVEYFSKRERSDSCCYREDKKKNTRTSNLRISSSGSDIGPALDHHQTERKAHSEKIKYCRSEPPLRHHSNVSNASDHYKSNFSSSSPTKYDQEKSSKNKLYFYPIYPKKRIKNNVHFDSKEFEQEYVCSECQLLHVTHGFEEIPSEFTPETQVSTSSSHLGNDWGTGRTSFTPSVLESPVDWVCFGCRLAHQFY